MITDRETIMAIVDNDCLTNSDAGILLEGDGFFRFQKAVELYQRGRIARIVFSGNIVEGWKKLALIASHEHQYRAYLTFLREVLDTKSGIILYNAPVRNLNWFIDSGWGIRFERLSAEFDRIEKYSAMGHLATAQEVVEYQKWKESLLV